ncbi:MAG: M60 family metallopeptidase [Paramuribaculum sp.]|nr:M60 family metallopeptidase [Paramuribaculum sp.]
MNSFLRYFNILELIAFIFIFSACSENDEPSQPPYLKIETTILNFDENGSTRTVTVDSNTDWACSSSADWVTVAKQGNNLVVTAAENGDKAVRTASVSVSGGGSLSHTIEIQQLGWGKAILLSISSKEVPTAGEIFTVEVTANVEVKNEISQGWIKDVPASRASHPMVTSAFDFNVQPNAGDDARSATVTFRDAEEGSVVQPVTLSVRQGGLGKYEPGDLGIIKDDIQVKVVRGEASSYQPGGEIEKSFDGDLSTIYHSNWNNSGDNYYPITLTYFFDREDMDYFVYYPRQQGYNGYFREVDIEVMTNANSRAQDEWVKVMCHDFGGSSSTARVDFPEPLIGVSAVRFTVRSGYGDGQGFASCAEMMFFKRNPDNFDWSTLFTDASCSELKEGMTESDIEACSFSFFKNIAYYMYHGRYQTEFRVNSFSAYQHPTRQASVNKTSRYSLLDNPTGIKVNEGDELLVLADLKGEGVSLRVQNLDVPNGDGFGGIEYPIATGVNKLKITEKGLVYVMYHTDSYMTAPRVNLHFVTGQVNGYFDSQNPEHNGRERDLLYGAVDSYFDVVGRYAHLTFPTQSFKSYTKDLRALIDIYDKIVYSEQQLLGLEKYGRMFNNRMYFNVMYTSYMYSTWYHTAYHADTMGELCDETKISTSSIWGPAHEVGHSNQTTGLTWVGMTEVSNNIMSQYVQTTVFGQPSRLQTENLGDASNPNRYSKSWNSIMVKAIPHATSDDVFCKLVPFWQLELYFGKVLGRTPTQQEDKGGFYPDCYEYLRTHSNIADNGAAQLEFAFIASLCAEADLTDFFEKWGFFTPVDVTIDDYGTARLAVTQNMADAMRQRIKALGFDKPQEPIEYITDNNQTVFRSQLHIVEGTAARSDNRLTMNDWKNVVVYEVRADGPTGKLIHVSDGMREKSTVATFTVPTWQSNYRVYAVQFDGKRIEVKF